MIRQLFLLVGILISSPAINAQFSFPGPPPSRSRQGFGVNVPDGYLPPRRKAVPCTATQTRVLTSTRTDLVTRTSSGRGVASTSFVNIPQFRTHTRVTTLVNTVLSTLIDVDTRTQTRVTTVQLTTTIGGLPITRTVVQTSVVPQFVTNTRYSTIRQTDINTRTVVATSVRQSVNLITSAVRRTVVVTSERVTRLPDRTETALQSTFVQTTRTAQSPPRTSVTNVIIPQTVETTRVIQGRPIQQTSVNVQTQIRTRTVTTTVRDVNVVTRTVTSNVINFVTVTRTDRQLVTSTVRVDSARPQIIRTTVVSNVVRPTTVFGGVDRTRTVQGPQVVRTTRVIITSTIRGPEGVLQTRTITTTRFRTQTELISGGRNPQTVLRTEYISQTCARPRYTYTEPTRNRFSFP